MAGLLDVCNEVLHSIIMEVEPPDLAALSQSCRTLNSYIKSSRLLFRDMYLRRWDPPNRSDKEIDWAAELQKVVRFQKTLESSNIGYKRKSIAPVSGMMDQLLKSAAPNPTTPRNAAFLGDLFASNENTDVFLCSSTLYGHAKADDEQADDQEEADDQEDADQQVADQQAADTAEERQLSAKMHCLYGVPLESEERICAGVHSYARAVVYDLRRYTEAAQWGPFQDDGSMRVDWEKVEAIMVVLGYNLTSFSHCARGTFAAPWEDRFTGSTPNSFVPRKACPALPPLILVKQLDTPLAAQDPYGVTGTWRRIVCFLDYNDFFTFNFTENGLPTTSPLPSIHTEEAIRLITLRLRVTKISAPGEDDRQALPVVHFRGTSRSFHSASWDPNANSHIRGTVRMTPEGEVRWTTVSVFHGEARWRSEGIQIGGVRSARGVLGNWFDNDYDEHGPAGPTAFWKISEEVAEGMEEAFDD